MAFSLVTSSVAITTLPSVTLTSERNLTVGIFYPISGDHRTIANLNDVLDWTLDRVRAQYGDLFDLGVRVKDTTCDTEEALSQYLDTTCVRDSHTTPIDAVIGEL
jgi:hypothetical protein